MECNAIATPFDMLRIRRYGYERKPHMQFGAQIFGVGELAYPNSKVVIPKILS